MHLPNKRIHCARPLGIRPTERSEPERVRNPIKEASLRKEPRILLTRQKPAAMSMLKYLMANGFTPSLADLAMAWALGFDPNALAELGIPWGPIVLGPGAWAPQFSTPDRGHLQFVDLAHGHREFIRSLARLGLGTPPLRPGLAPEHGALCLVAIQ
jgi:hypothetical protein